MRQLEFAYRKKLNIVFGLLMVMVVSGCATTTQNGEPADRNNKAIGAVIGAVAGAVIGGQLDDDGNRDRGVITGAILGAAAGAGVGHVMDRQEQEFRDALAEEKYRSEVEIQRVRDDLLKLTFDGEVTFDFGKATVKSSFMSSVEKLAGVLSKYGSQVTIVGHTDSVGDADYNMQLSEARAQAVADKLVSRGVSSEQITVKGRGEYEPRESNETEAGRALNRRVEFFVTPPVQ